MKITKTAIAALLAAGAAAVSVAAPAPAAPTGLNICVVTGPAGICHSTTSAENFPHPTHDVSLHPPGQTPYLAGGR